MNEIELAIDASMNLSADGDEYHVINHHSEFLEGSLYVVAFKMGDEEKHNFVYMESGVPSVFKNQALLNEFVARKTRKKGFVAVLESIGGIAGIIGIIITLAIVYLVVKSPDAEIPQVLSGALTAILGFYFGSKSK